MKAVFLDRDGTMGGDGHGIDPAKFTMYDFTPAAIQLLNEAGIKVFLFTNQSRVGRGYFTEQELLKGFETMEAELKRHSAYLDGIYYCPHHPDEGCDCLKPETGMLERARKEHGLDLKKCYVVGDNGGSDMLAASRAGTRMVLVKTGKGENSRSEYNSNWPETEPDHIAENLLGAAEWILQDTKKGANA
ncbi:D-glycero-alpha-D-manno-heptose-1,7-bisphosphate 7-phosphatase [Planococcus sp. X10-3]|uniref:D-glycero-alpha-D-manno-heptose-1,7-bisphosphate 7-phosphatase n=1 Tax=Planococcus sp. X10-3 TaxID=3061240 RepID=UPI003BB1844E